MKITKKFEITVTINTKKANTNTDKWGDTYDWNAYPNWEINYAGQEDRFIKSCISEFRNNFKFTGLSCKIKELKESKVFCDLFAGTGAIGRSFKT